VTSLVRAKDFLQHGDLLSSFELFQKANEESGYSENEKLYILDSLCEISLSLGRSKNLETLEKLSYGYFSVAQYKKSLELCEEALGLSDKYHLYELQVKIHQVLGNVNELEKSLNVFLNYLIRKRDTNKALDLLNNDSFNITNKKKWFYKMKCFLLMGDIASIEKHINELVLIEADEKEELIKVIGGHTLYWHSSDIIKKWVLESLSSNFSRNSIAKKDVIKLLSDIYYFSQDVPISLLEKSLVVSKKWSLYGLGYTISSMTKDSKMEDYFLSNLPNELITDEKFDMGKDFLTNDMDLLESEYVNKISFLESIGKKREALKQRKIFEKKYPESTMIEINNNEEKDDLNVDIIKTLEEISKRGEKNYQHENSIDDLHVSIGSIDKKDLHENYSEIASTLNMMKEYGKVIKLADLLLEDISKGEIYLDIAYLKIEALLQTEKYYDARDLSEKVILENSLNSTKKLTFDYLLAESYFLLEEYTKAKCIYLEIFKSNKSYRLTKNRLKAIEEN
jgi:tetratricopeptide (TPR) repeat protein